MIKLRDYQQQILDELDYVDSIGLFMGTGTGKTFTSLSRVRRQPTDKLLVICPSKISAQWKDNIRIALPEYKIIEYPQSMTAQNINEDLRKRHEAGISLIEPNIALVVTLEIVAKLTALDKILNINWCIIVDESHKIKEYGTQRNPVKVTHAVLKLGALVKYKMILTATPTQKANGGFIDYYTQLRFLGYMNMSLAEFKNTYCILQKIQPVGMPYPISIIKGYKNTQAIEKVLKLTCRRYIARVGDFEPQHIKFTVPKAKNYARLARERAYGELDLTNLSARRMAKKTLTSGVVSGHDTYGKVLLYPDNTQKIDMLEEFLSNTDELVIVYYKYNVERDQLIQLCTNLGYKPLLLNGDNHRKYESIREDTYDIIIAQIDAAGESLDGLQYKSHICVYYTMPESSLSYRQSLGRIDRVGQEKVPMYYYLVMEGTIDAEIYDMVQKKIEFSEHTLEQLEV